MIAPLNREHGLGYLIAAVILGGVIQIVLGVLGVARLMRFVPRAVMVGFVNALAVLSRADEVGGGRLDALLSARGIAARYREMPSLRPLAVTVVPVAGLIAESARTMQERDFAALREIALWDRDQRDRLLLSADRFIREDASALDARTRAGLLDRFGIAGIRLGVALVRGGSATWRTAGGAASSADTRNCASAVIVLFRKAMTARMRGTN